MVVAQSSWHNRRGTIVVAQSSWHNRRGTIVVAQSSWHNRRGTIVSAFRGAKSDRQLWRFLAKPEASRQNGTQFVRGTGGRNRVDRIVIPKL
jgi:hypothetical protein